jgi:hypothetical protein
MSFQQNVKIPVLSRYCPLTQTTFTRSVLGNAHVLTDRPNFRIVGNPSLTTLLETWPVI